MRRFRLWRSGDGHTTIERDEFRRRLRVLVGRQRREVTDEDLAPVAECYRVCAALNALEAEETI